VIKRKPGPFYGEEGGAMKKSIEWHENCLKNMTTYYQSQRSELDRLKLEVGKFACEILFYDGQIARAKREKRDGFDRDRFMVKTGGKND